jgi:hypothetical protein
VSQLSHAQFPLRWHPISSSIVDERGVPQLQLEAYLDAYLQAAGILEAKRSPLSAWHGAAPTN